MKSSHQTLTKTIPIIIILFSLFGLNSCGSYYNVSQEDGIYNSRDYTVYQEQRDTRASEKEIVYEQEDNFFAKKLASYENVEQEDVLTDIESYNYKSENEDAPWGYSNNITITVVDPYYYRNYWNSYYYDDFYYGYYPSHYYYYRPYYNPYNNPYHYSHYNPYYYSPYYGSGF
ncbi:MAG TPA: hypothetical protein VFY09_01500, partial [Flavobacteriaceae bacterium]|nr:hypothetical protein [Flavobacteriaceae bacterium]